MYSVTSRIRNIKQPWGGYIPVKWFKKERLYDKSLILKPNENLHGSIIGLAVDYLFRYITTGNALTAFDISYNGALRLDAYREDIRFMNNLEDLNTEESLRFISLTNETLILEEDRYNRLIDGLKTLDDDITIINACMLSGYDVLVRSSPLHYRDISLRIPNADTIENIRLMVSSVLDYFKIHGPITNAGFTFESINDNPSGYSDIVSTGDGDFLTKDTLWDLKVAKLAMTNRYALQIYMYYLMGLKTKHKEFLDIKNIGVVNPRANAVYTLSIDDIPDNIRNVISYGVIGHSLDVYPTTSDKYFDFNISTGYIEGYDINGGLIVKIPDLIDGINVVGIGDGAFKSKNIIRLSLPKHLICIGDRAFNDNDLEILDIPSSVTDIGIDAFSDNKLKKLNLYDLNESESSCLEYIGHRAFYNNSLYSINFPDRQILVKGEAFVKNEIYTCFICTKILLDKHVFDSRVRLHVHNR